MTKQDRAVAKIIELTKLNSHTWYGIYGGPGVGKSTTAAGLFYLMKTNDYNVELVTEVAKDYTWENREQCLEDQLYIFAKQNHRLERLKTKVDYVIVDSPLLLGILYTPIDYYNNYNNIVTDVFNSYDNLNFYINRIKKYQPIGRNQTEEQSNEISIITRDLLKDHSYFEIDGNEIANLEIFTRIIENEK